MDILVILTAIFLNQSNIISDMNVSFSDIFLIIAVLYLIYQKMLFIPNVPLLYFLVLSVLTLFTAACIAPWQYHFGYAFLSLIREWLKLLMLFLYLVLGYYLMAHQKIRILFRWYSVGALVIGFVGIIFTVFNIPAFRSILFFAGTRYKGFMNDPNYFSVIMVSALCYLLRNEVLSIGRKWVGSLIVLISVILSGSKTGIIIFVIYVFWVLVEYILRSAPNRNAMIKKAIIVLGLAVLLPPGIQMFLGFLDRIALVLPVFNRIGIVFTDFGAALNEGGSSRGDTWTTALKVIKMSPVSGVGIGTYTSVAQALSGSRAIAHNTYLQLLAEWGIPMTVAFFSYLLVLLIKVTFNSHKSFEAIVLRDILLVVLLGSIAISLNNARILWIGMGGLMYTLKTKNTVSVLNKLN